MPVIGDATIIVRGQSGPFIAQLGALQGRAGGIFRAIEQTAVSALAAAGKAITAVSAVAVGAAAAAFASFEEAFAGVRRTVEGTPEQLEEVRQAFLRLSTTIPVSANDLAEIGLVAGQLGIRVDDIEKFTETVAKLGLTTELSTRDAAEGLGRIAVLTRATGDEFNALASVLVDLGNKFNSTEADILDLSLRIVGAANVVGIAKQEVLGIANAFASVVGPQGLEAAGTAIQRVLIEMGKAVSTGGDTLAQFAKVAGLSIEEFRRLFREDPAEAFVRFVEGIRAAGDDAFQLFDDLDLDQARLIRSFTQMASRSDELRRSLDLANEEFREQDALTAEVNKRIETLVSQFSILRNRLFEVGVRLGEILRPGIVEGFRVFGDVLSEALDRLRPAFDDLNEQLPTIARALGLTLSATVAASAKAISLFADAVVFLVDVVLPVAVPILQSIRDSIKEIGAAAPTAVDALGGLARTIGEGLALVLRETAPALADLINVLAFGLAAIARSLVPAFEGIAELLGALARGFTSVVDSFRPFLDGIGLFVDAVATHLAPSVERLLSFLGDVAGTVAADLLRAFQGIAPEIARFLDALTDGLIKLRPGLTAVIDGLSTLVGAVLSGFTPLAEALGGALGAIGDALGNVFSRLAPTIESALRVLAPFVEQLGTALVEAIEDASPLIDALLDVLANIAETALPRVLGALGPVVDSLATALVPVVQALGDSLREVLPLVAEGLAGALEEILPAVGDLLVALTPIAEDVLVALAGIIEEVAPLVATLAEGFATLVEALQPVVEDVGQALVERVGEIVDAIEPLIPQLVDALVPVIEELGALLVELIPVAGDIVVAFLDLFDAVAPLLPPLAELVSLGLELVRVVLTPVLPLLEDFSETLALIARVAVPPLTLALEAINFAIREIVIPAFSLLLDAILATFDTIISAAATAFGWIPGIGGQLREANTAFDKFRDEVNRTLDEIRDREVTVTGRFRFQGGGGGTSRGHGATGSFAHGGRILAGQLGLVGEVGPELFVPSTNGQIVSNDDLVKILSSVLSGGRGGGDTNVTVVEAHADPLATAFQVSTELALQAER